ncbi:MAG TPA: ABC transporter permease, partial [Pyrinomonadaceae bacterium]|nr:ABC transporter permease [Pyrinomonadaceae bacterium]
MRIRELRAWVVRLAGLFGRKQRDRELAEELESHLQMHIDDNVRAGMTPQEARRQALIKLGGMAQTQEEYRRRRSVPVIENLWQDLRFGARGLVKQPAFTLVALLTLALGIGANTALFSVINAVLLRPLPYPNSRQLVTIKRVDPRGSNVEGLISYPNFKDYREQARSLQYVAAYSDSYAWLGGNDVPERIEGVYASADLFPALGVNAALGRTFTAEEDEQGAPLVAVISHGLWQRRFGSDPSIIGREMLLDGDKTKIVGVMPGGFSFPAGQEAQDFWVPLGSSGYGETLKNRRANNHLVVAALKPDITLQQAQAELEAVNNRLSSLYPEANGGLGIRVTDLQTDVVGNVRPALLVLLVSVAFVLLIACVNVANLLLARAATRGREMALRMALGASRGRLVQQVLTESFLLSCAGGAIGLFVAFWLLPMLIAINPGNIPRVAEINMDARVLAFAFGISILTGVLFGLVPALKVSGVDLNEALKEGGRGSTGGLGRSRVRSLLVISEVALSLVLLVGAGLLIRSFVALLATPPGYDPSRVMTASIEVSRSDYPEPELFFHEVTERVKALPGVEAAGVTSLLPLSPSDTSVEFKIDGRVEPQPGAVPVARPLSVNPDYFRVMRVTIKKGRGLTPQDTKQSARVVLVNEELARRYFAGEDPMGKRLILYHTYAKSEPLPYEVVGVVSDIRHRGLNVPASPEFYVSYMQMPPPRMTLVVRSATPDTASLTASVQGAIREVDKGARVWDFRHMDERLSDSVAPQRLNTMLLGLLSLVALVLSATGILGVMSYTVAERTHEIGIRMALGAQKADILRLVVGKGMFLTLCGVCVGSVAALALTRLMEGLLFGVSATDPVTFIGIGSLLFAVAFVACYVPARR